MDNFVYPPNIKHFTKVLFATEPGAGPAQWEAGFVVKVKNQSCDIFVMRSEGTDIRQDCWHADDPRCKTDPQMYRMPGRGVFRLAEQESENKTASDEMYRLRRDLREITNKVNKMQESHEKLIDEVIRLSKPATPAKPAHRKEAALIE